MIRAMQVRLILQHRFSSDRPPFSGRIFVFRHRADLLFW